VLEKFYVVCDANGECKGVFTIKSVAAKISDYFGACVSEQKVADVLPSEVNDWIDYNG
jgi:hypothetical protein